MKILQVYNAYQYKSGEDTVVEEEKSILEANGHTVIQYLKHNEEIFSYNKTQKIKFSLNLRGSKKVALEFSELLKEEKPDICHVHNVFSVITPIIFQICNDHQVPVIQTLHNYRLLCTNTLFFREGKVCEVCMGKSLLNSVKYKCFRNSYTMTALMADSIQYHRNKSTWIKRISAYICLSEFARKKFIQGGLPENKLIVKPNFTTKQTEDIEYGDFFLYVGRLESAKGLADFIELIKQRPNINFVAIGHCDAPEQLSELKNIEYLGQRSKTDVISHLRKCKALIFPSQMYEGMPMVIIESFSMKKPVIARNLGVMATMIRNEQNGLLFSNTKELIMNVDKLNANTELCKKFGLEAYRDFMDNYSPEMGYANLIAIYNKVKDEYAPRL